VPTLADVVSAVRIQTLENPNVCPSNNSNNEHSCRI